MSPSSLWLERSRRCGDSPPHDRRPADGDLPSLLGERPGRRPPSSVLSCLKSKSRCAPERRTNKSGNGSPTPASISPAKRFADSFAVARKKARISAPRGGKRVEVPDLHAQQTAAVVDHDPLANLRKFEASRAGFSFSRYAKRGCPGAWKKGIP